MLRIEEEIIRKFPGLAVELLSVEKVKIKKRSEDLRKFKESTFARIKKENEIENLKDDPIIRAYRDFFWKLGIDPTKIRPASEALIRRILQRGELPEINTLVDAYNLVSAVSKVPIAAFDRERIEGDLLMRSASQGEEFLGINMEKPMKLKGNELVVSDSKKLIAIYPYKDAESTKIREETKSVLFMICGAPGVEGEHLERARKLLEEWIPRFCGGEIGEKFRAP